MLVERHLGWRRYPRYNTDKALQAQVYQREHASNHVQGRMQQFGEGGLGALMANQLTLGQVICVELAQDLHVYASVRYLRGFNHGFEFVMVTERQRNGIRKICQSLAPRVCTA